MVLLKSFFYNKDLRRAGLCAGWLGIISSIFKLVKLLTTTKEYFIDYKPANVDVQHYSYVIWQIAIGIVLFLGFISSLLLWGSYKGRRFFLLPWLITYAILLVFIIPVIVFMGFLCLIEPSSELLGITLIFLPLSLFYVYLWLCVLSLYQKLCEDDIDLSPKKDEENSPYFLTLDSGIPYKKM